MSENSLKQADPRPSRKRGQKIAPSEIDRLIGMRIRIARNISGKKQDELANYLNLTLQQTQKYENGKNKISVNILTQISEYFNIPISYFIPSRVGSHQENIFQAFSTFDSISAPKIAEDWQPIGSNEDEKEEKSIVLKIMETVTEIKDLDNKKKALEYITELKNLSQKKGEK